jgi:hypothetical protein
MIHIATVHFGSERWIEIQRRYLDRFITEPFRVYASLERVPAGFESFFDVVVPSYGRHPGKLNHLGHVILNDADPQDLIFFLDGDAFPIADPVGPVMHRLETASLTAICRLENGGDHQPHPSFCAVRASVWADLGGDWSEGYPLPGRVPPLASWGEGVSDIGANLLYLLESSGTAWSPILRSNRRNLHPVLFGIYGGFLYHHGAGFRRPVTRHDIDDLFGSRCPPSREGSGETPAPTTGRSEGISGPPDTAEAIADTIRRNSPVASEVFARIKADPDFYRQFL